jgi:hypothetical protein
MVAQAPAQIAQKPERGDVRPVRVIDDEEQWPFRGQVGRKPEQSVVSDTGHGVVRACAHRVREDGARRCGGAGQEAGGSLLLAIDELSFQQLAGDAERKGGFEF